MSSALLRQALEFVDQEEGSRVSKSKRNKRVKDQRLAGQDPRIALKSKSKKPKETVKTKQQLTEENIKKLLALSEPVANNTHAEKIIERAVKGRPLADKIQIQVDEDKPILFDEEGFKTFEKQYFCS